MAKPRGPICNLACAYCFYLRKESLYGAAASFRMSSETLDTFTRQVIEAHPGDEVTFAWQGGEPTLMGMDFYREVVEAQRRHGRPGMAIRNAIQTNGIVLDDLWCAFLREHAFLVGLSLDGPERLHDANRVDRGGRPTHARVLRALHLLQRHGVEHNVLCVVSRVHGGHSLEVYRFLRSEGVRFIQLIPATERLPCGDVTSWTVLPRQWGAFLCGVFDEWVRHDVGRVFVQQFDVALEAWCGQEPSLCTQARTCGNCLAMEHNGDLYACDHYVEPGYRLGNVHHRPIMELVMDARQRQFGADKRDRLPLACRQCGVLFACNGGCPRERFSTTPGGDPDLNYLCEGWKRFFTHIDGPMREMAELLAAGRAPALIMERLMARDRAMKAAGRNDPCPCGSGRKHKSCCMRP